MQMRAARCVVSLCALPGGAREREMLLGDTFKVEDTRDGWVFGHTALDGYPGWVARADLVEDTGPAPTHFVSAIRSFAKAAPGLKETSTPNPLPFGAALVVTEIEDGWATVRLPGGTGFVPGVHLAPLTQFETDPVSVAERFLGTPYLWGGNSSFGIDCSGLVQAACRACAIPCPGDSGPQERALGTSMPTGTPVQRGDLLFWKGHVAWALNNTTLLHANAYHMAVATEPLAEAIARIQLQGDGPVTRHARLT